MFSTIWHTLFFDPVYNILVFFIDVLPSFDVGLAVVISVIIVKIILLPVALKASRTTQIIKKIQPELNELQKKYKDKREELALHMLEIYRREKINPFSPILILLIQLPIIFALYFAVRSLPEIQTELLYGFIKIPEMVNMVFLGIIPMDAKHLGLALFAAITMYIQAKITVPAKEEKKKNEQSSFSGDLQESMRMSMLYVMPVMIGVASYTLTAVFALYFTISNVTSILQELYVRKKLP